jgi:hypothetical protein
VARDDHGQWRQRVRFAPSRDPAQRLRYIRHRVSITPGDAPDKNKCPSEMVAVKPPAC